MDRQLHAHRDALDERLARQRELERIIDDILDLAWAFEGRPEQLGVHLESLTASGRLSEREVDRVLDVLDQQLGADFMRRAFAGEAAWETDLRAVAATWREAAEHYGGRQDASRQPADQLLEAARTTPATDAPGHLVARVEQIAGPLGGPVKVHRGPEVTEALRAVRARGASFGDRVLVDDTIGSAAQRERTLAHELAHASQKGGAAPAAMKAAMPASERPLAEQHAHAVAALAVRDGGSAGTRLPGAAVERGALHLDELPSHVVTDPDNDLLGADTPLGRLYDAYNSGSSSNRYLDRVHVDSHLTIGMGHFASSTLRSFTAALLASDAGGDFVDLLVGYFDHHAAAWTEALESAGLDETLGVGDANVRAMVSATLGSSSWSGHEDDDAPSLSWLSDPGGIKRALMERSVAVFQVEYWRDHIIAEGEEDARSVGMEAAGGIGMLTGTRSSSVDHRGLVFGAQHGVVRIVEDGLNEVDDYDDETEEWQDGYTFYDTGDEAGTTLRVETDESSEDDLHVELGSARIPRGTPHVQVREVVPATQHARRTTQRTMIRTRILDPQTGAVAHEGWAPRDHLRRADEEADEGFTPGVFDWNRMPEELAPSAETIAAYEEARGVELPDFDPTDPAYLADWRALISWMYYEGVRGSDSRLRSRSVGIWEEWYEPVWGPVPEEGGGQEIWRNFFSDRRHLLPPEDDPGRVKDGHMDAETTFLGELDAGGEEGEAAPDAAPAPEVEQAPDDDAGDGDSGSLDLPGLEGVDPSWQSEPPIRLGPPEVYAAQRDGQPGWVFVQADGSAEFVADETAEAIPVEEVSFEEGMTVVGDADATGDVGLPAPAATFTEAQVREHLGGLSRKVDWYDDQGWNGERADWAAAVGAALGLPEGAWSPAVTEDFVVAVALFQANYIGALNGDVDGVIGGTGRAWLAQSYPGAGWPASFTRATHDVNNSADKREQLNQIVSDLQAHGWIEERYGSHEEWTDAVMVAASFLGRPVDRGVHPDLAAKLQEAEAALGRQPDYYGIQTIGGFRKGSSHHGWGGAIDIDSTLNPYIMHEAQDSSSYNEALGEIWHRIARFMLGRDSVIPEQILSGREESSLDVERNMRMYDALVEESDAMIRYFAYRGDAAALEATDQDARQSAFGTTDAGAILAVIDEDYRKLGDGYTPSAGDAVFVNRDIEDGYITLRREIVETLVRVGLRWGGAGLGNASGDIMHFDMNYEPFGEAWYAAKKHRDIPDRGLED